MSSFVFRCPRRKLMVQGWAEESQDGKGEYVPYRCPACGGMHLVNPRTGKLPSEERASDKDAGDRKGDRSP